MAHICQHLAAMHRATPDKVMTVCEGHLQTVADFTARVAALSVALKDRLGLQSGDRVAMAALNTDRCFETMLAILSAGGLVTPLNWRWSLQDAVQALAPCSPTILIIDGPCARYLQLAQHISSIRHTIHLGSSCEVPAAPPAIFQGDSLIDQYLGAELSLHSADSGAAVLCFTSGTTSAAKAAILSHTAFHCQSLSKLLMIGYTCEEVYYHSAPLCHIGGLSSAFAVLMSGGSHIFPTQFAAERMLWDLDRHQVTSFIAVPAMLSALVAAVEAASGGSQRQFKHVGRVLVGGGTPTAAMLHRCSSLFPAAVVKLSYAMTEACSSMTFTTIAAPGAQKQAEVQQSATQHIDLLPAVCVGRPAPGIEIDIKPMPGLAPGHGTIVTRGPHVMLGYWPGGAPFQRHPDSWFSTGDVGYLDTQGRLWLNGRARDVIRTGSETVHASEVERCLQLHPDVQAAAVVGIADACLGQQVSALVQLQRPSNGDVLGRHDDHGQAEQSPQHDLPLEQRLRAFCKSSGLSGYKVPRLICWQTLPLPANASGKVLKHEVRSLIEGITKQSVKSRL